MALTKRKRILLEILVVAGIALTLGSLLLVAKVFDYKEAASARVFRENTLIKEFDLNSLSEEGEYYIVPMEGDDFFRIHAKKGAIAVVASSCPGQDCVNQGYVREAFKPIICAHHRIYIELSGTPSMAVEI